MAKVVTIVAGRLQINPTGWHDFMSDQHFGPQELDIAEFDKARVNMENLRGTSTKIGANGKPAPERKNQSFLRLGLRSNAGRRHDFHPLMEDQVNTLKTNFLPIIAIRSLLYC